MCRGVLPVSRLVSALVNLVSSFTDICILRAPLRKQMSGFAVVERKPSGVSSVQKETVTDKTKDVGEYTKLSHPENKTGATPVSAVLRFPDGVPSYPPPAPKSSFVQNIELPFFGGRGGRWSFASKPPPPHAFTVSHRLRVQNAHRNETRSEAGETLRASAKLRSIYKGLAIRSAVCTLICQSAIECTSKIP